MTSKTYELADLDSLAEWILEESLGEKIWVFRGELGAGKTTLIQALGRKIGLLDSVSSPSFGLVNPYQTASGKTIYHFDFYRIQRPEEALDIGLEDYFEDGDFCWIEWPEKIVEFLPDQFFSIKIEYHSSSSRKITLAHFDDV